MAIFRATRLFSTVLLKLKWHFLRNSLLSEDLIVLLKSKREIWGHDDHWSVCQMDSSLEVNKGFGGSLRGLEIIQTFQNIYLLYIFRNRYFLRIYDALKVYWSFWKGIVLTSFDIDCLLFVLFLASWMRSIMSLHTLKNSIRLIEWFQIFLAFYW